MRRATGFFRPHMVFNASLRAPEADGASPDQFRHVMLPHMDAAYNFARYLSRDPVAAEDIVQEAFLRAFRGFGNWRGEAAKSWLLAIVRNCYLDWVRSNQVEPHVGDGAHVAHDLDTPESLLLQARDATMLRTTIAELPEPFRETLVLRELEEFSYKEIAAITAVPIGTVMSRLARAREMLCVLLLPDTEHQRKAQS